MLILPGALSSANVRPLFCSFPLPPISRPPTKIAAAATQPYGPIVEASAAAASAPPSAAAPPSESAPIAAPVPAASVPAPVMMTSPAASIVVPPAKPAAALPPPNVPADPAAASLPTLPAPVDQPCELMSAPRESPPVMPVILALACAYGDTELVPLSHAEIEPEPVEV